MALICTLPAEYNNFISSLLLLNSLDLSKLQSAFQNEESQCFACSIDSSPSLAMVAGTMYTPSQGICCMFCDWEGHTEASCKFKENAAKTQKAKTADCRQEHKGSKKKAQTMQEVSEDIEASANIAEYAGKASVTLSASDRSSWLLSLAAANWNTDTGATSHMTPHRHWFASYSPHIIPVHLANNTIIYTAGMGVSALVPIRTARLSSYAKQNPLSAWFEPAVLGDCNQGGDDDDDALPHPPPAITPPPSPSPEPILPPGPPPNVDPPANPPPRRSTRLTHQQGSLNETALRHRNLTPPGARVSPAAPSRASDSPDTLELPTPSPAPPDEFYPPDNDVEEDEVNIGPGYVKDKGDLASAMSAGMDFVLAGQTVEYWSWEDSLDYAFESVVQTAFKGDKHT
ncbi:hypothetical protein NEOLEDRAFT_1178396, partial [Neolentinus lepideus HHB14362 ss-1]